MFITSLDHVNIRTASLLRLSRFYAEVLGFPAGERPNFSMGGAWHYCGDQAVVHLVEVATPPRGLEPRLEHFAFRARGLADFLAHLRTHRVAYRVSLVPGRDIRQVNVHDPDGNRIEIQFDATEQADISPYHGD